MTEKTAGGELPVTADNLHWHTCMSVSPLRKKKSVLTSVPVCPTFHNNLLLPSIGTSILKVPRSTFSSLSREETSESHVY